jgi:hypothetical protein
MKYGQNSTPRRKLSSRCKLSEGGVHLLPGCDRARRDVVSPEHLALTYLACRLHSLQWIILSTEPVRPLEEAAIHAVMRRRTIVCRTEVSAAPAQQRG